MSFDLKQITTGLVDIGHGELKDACNFTNLRGFFLPLAILLMWQAYPRGLVAPLTFEITAVSIEDDFRLAKYYESLGFMWDGNDENIKRIIKECASKVYTMSALSECQHRQGGQDMNAIVRRLGIDIGDIIPRLTGPCERILNTCESKVKTILSERKK